MNLVLLFLSAFASVELPPKAIALLRSGDGPQAFEIVREAVDEAPEDHALRADAVELGFALKRWKVVLAWTRGDERLARQHARATFFAGRFEEALALLSEADDLEAFMILDSLEALGRFPEHDATLTRLAKRFGRDHVHVASVEGRVALRKRDWSRAIERFRAALELDPWHSEAIFGLGRALVFSGEREAGRQELERHRRLLPLFDELEFARRGVELDPSHGPNHARVGDVERRLGRIESAQAHYRSALDRTRGAERTPIVLRLARSLVEDKADVAAARELLAEETAERFDARLLVRLGDLARDAKDLVAARRAYERVLERRPEDRAVLERLRGLGQ